MTCARKSQVKDVPKFFFDSTCEGEGCTNKLELKPLKEECRKLARKQSAPAFVVYKNKLSGGKSRCWLCKNDKLRASSQSSSSEVHWTEEEEAIIAVPAAKQANAPIKPPKQEKTADLDTTKSSSKVADECAGRKGSKPTDDVWCLCNSRGKKISAKAGHKAPQSACNAKKHQCSWNAEADACEQKEKITAPPPPSAGSKTVQTPTPASAQEHALRLRMREHSWSMSLTTKAVTTQAKKKYTETQYKQINRELQLYIV